MRSDFADYISYKQRDAALRLLKGGNTNGALRPLSSAYKLCPADHQNTYDLALAEVLTGEYEKARSLVGDLLVFPIKRFAEQMLDMFAATASLFSMIKELRKGKLGWSRTASPSAHSVDGGKIGSILVANHADCAGFAGSSGL